MVHSETYKHNIVYIYLAFIWLDPAIYFYKVREKYSYIFEPLKKILLI